jgi:hypothetical protein
MKTVIRALSMLVAQSDAWPAGAITVARAR